MDRYIKLIQASLWAGFNNPDPEMKRVHYIECRYYLKVLELMIELQAEAEPLN